MFSILVVLSSFPAQTWVELAKRYLVYRCNGLRDITVYFHDDNPAQSAVTESCLQSTRVFVDSFSDLGRYLPTIHSMLELLLGKSELR